MNNLRFRLYDVTKHALGVYRKYVEQKLALRLEGDHVIFRGDLRHHKDTRTNFTISNTSGAMGSPKVPQMELLDISLTKGFFVPFYCKDFSNHTGLKNLAKKSAKQENASLFMNSILYNRKTRVKNHTNTRVKPRLKMPLKNFISGPMSGFLYISLAAIRMSMEVQYGIRIKVIPYPKGFLTPR